MLNKKALAGTPSTPPAFVEDVFSTYLYTGTGATQNIPNGIDLAGKGGLIWTKFRSGSFGTEQHALMDTVRGANNWIDTADTGAQITYANMLTSFNSNGYTLGSDSVGGKVNWSAQNYCSWTFREQPKFMDVITWTGNGVGGREISHSLGSTPGMIIAKRTDTTGVWYVYHRSLGGASNFLSLNTTNAVSSGTNIWFNTDPTSTAFTVGTVLNTTGGTYVAYLFAHNAGGFGTTGADNVISCGSFTGGAFLDVNLGYEPQYVMVKASSGSSDWMIFDTMRGMSLTSYRVLYPNLSQGEDTGGSTMFPTATGFRVNPANLYGNETYIYMAIRRPMKVPTTGTSVFSPVSQAGGGTVTTGFPTDLVLAAARTIGTGFQDQDRLRGFARELYPSSTSAEANNGSSGYNLNLSNTSFLDNQSSSSYTWIYECFRRASGFFDQVCYTGTGNTSTTQNHNLTVIPELIIVKRRSGTQAWCVFGSALGANTFAFLNTTAAASGGVTFTAATATTFGAQEDLSLNESGVNYVAYLFASCPGVSKVFSYTGNGSSQTINCAFTAGARFVMIKRTDSTGDWYVWDTARGIVSGNDPHLSLNTTAAEVTSNDSIDPDNSGFIVNQLSATNINVSSATYIGIAIA